MGNWFNNLGTSILEGIKSIFVPDTNELNASIDHLKNTFITTFGIGAYDLSPILSSEMKITDHKGKINIAGLKFEATFFDVDYLVQGIASFRPYIRGFIVLMMAFYNINQFLTIIGQNPISFGSFIKNDSPALPSTTHLLHD